MSNNKEKDKENGQGRKTTVIAVPEANPNQIDVEELSTKMEVTPDHIEILLATGRAQGVGFIKEVAHATEIRLIQSVIESKKFKGLPYKDSQGNLAHVQTLNEFCTHILHKSYDTINRYINNVEMLGDNYDKAIDMGLSLRDFAALKKLPDDSKKQILEHEAFKTGNVEQIREVVKVFSIQQQETIAQYEKDKTELNKQLAAKDKLYNLKEKKVNELDQKVTELEEKIATEGKFYTAEEQKNLRLEQILTAIQTQTRQVLATYNVTLRKLLTDLIANEGFEPVHQTIAGDMVVGAVRGMQDLLNDFNLETTTVLPFDANTTAAAEILPTLKAFFDKQ